MVSSYEQRRLAAQIAGVQRETRAASTTQQLAYSSIENGGRIIVKDGAGREVMDIGGNPDGSYGATPRIGPTPPQPTEPTLIATPGGITVRWDGEYLDSMMTPDDFTRIEVHLSPEASMTGEFSDTIVGTIETPRGADVPVMKLTPGTTYYALLVARNTAGGRGPASPMAASEPGPYADGPGTQQALTKAQEAVAKAEAARQEINAATLAANTAMNAATDAQNAADASLVAANGKNKLYWSNNGPGGVMPQLQGPNNEVQMTSDTPGQFNDGDIWYRRDAAQQNAILEMWEFGTLVNSTRGWKLRQVTDALVSSLTAGKITTGTLAAGSTITTGDPAGNHTEIGQGGLRVFKRNAEGDPVPTVNVGGAADDVIQIVDKTTGSTLAGFMQDGTTISQTVLTDTLEVGGTSLGNKFDRFDTLFGMARGFQTGFRMSTSSGFSATLADGAVPLAELRFFAEANRMYRITSSASIYKTKAGIARYQMRYSTDGSDPAIYTANTNQLYMGMVYTTIDNFHVRANTTSYIYAPDKDVRILVLIQNITPTSDNTHRMWYYPDPPGFIAVEDVGAVPSPQSEIWGSGSMRSSSSSADPTPTTNSAQKSYTKTYAPTWSRTWRDGSVRGDTADMVQGTYGGRTNRAAVGFGSQIATDLAGATVTSMTLRLYANNWYYNSGGTAIIGNHGQTSAPGSFPGGGSTFPRVWKAKTGLQNISIPSDWWPYWVSGAHRGFTLGDGAGSGLGFYGRFNGANDTASTRPMLTVTYKR